LLDISLDFTRAGIWLVLEFTGLTIDMTIDKRVLVN